MQWSPTDALAAKPLEVPDPFGLGIVFRCVRSQSRRFRPLFNPQRRFARAMLSQRFFSTLRDLPDSSKKLIAGQAESMSEEEFAAAASDFPAEKLLAICEIGEQAKAATQSADELPKAARVAPVLLGWEGIQNGDGPLEFTPERALGMLTDGAQGDAEAAFLVDGKPFEIQAGPWAGYTMGEALRLYLPEAIERMSTEELEAVEKKKGKPSAGASGTGGSRTVKKRSRPRPTASAKKGSSK